jgi:hypothetical protein
VVFSYAGGVGTRSGDPADVGRLLLAALYQQSTLDRAEGRREDAARLTELLAARFPEQLEVQLMLAESQLEDRQNAEAAIDTLDRLELHGKASLPRLRHGVLRLDALLALRRLDEARAALRSLQAEFPGNGIVAARAASLEQAQPAVSRP